MSSYGDKPASTPPDTKEGVMEVTTVQSLTDAIRGRRQALRMTQEGLATAAGVSRSYVLSLEHGRTTVDLKSILSVLDVLGLVLEVRSRDEIEDTKGTDLDRILSDYDLGSE